LLLLLLVRQWPAPGRREQRPETRQVGLAGRCRQGTLGRLPGRGLAQVLVALAGAGPVSQPLLPPRQERLLFQRIERWLGSRIAQARVQVLELLLLDRNPPQQVEVLAGHQAQTGRAFLLQYLLPQG